MSGLKTIALTNQWRPTIELTITGKEPLGWLYIQIAKANPLERNMVNFFNPKLQDISNISRSLAELGLVNDMPVGYILGGGRYTVLTEEFYQTAQALHDAYEGQKLQAKRTVNAAQLVINLH